MVRNEEIAKLAGVSAVTVSRVLNNAPGVAAVTREAVIDAAKKLGRSLIPDITRKQVLVISVFSGLDLVEPLIRVSEGYNISLLFKNIYQSGLAEIIQQLEGNYDGALLVDCDVTQEEIEPLLERMPIVQCRNYNGLSSEISVLMDDTAAGDMLTSHLIETGKKRIAVAHLNEYLSARPHGRERLNGIHAALARHQMPLVSEYNLEHPGVWEQIKKDARKCWDALILPAPIKELPTLRYSWESEGISFPDDLGIAVLEDGPAAQLSEVTAIAQPFLGIARNALFLLSSLMERRLTVEESIQMRLAPQLLIRSSTVKSKEESPCQTKR